MLVFLPSHGTVLEMFPRAVSATPLCVPHTAEHQRYKCNACAWTYVSTGLRGKPQVLFVLEMCPCALPTPPKP